MAGATVSSAECGSDLGGAVSRERAPRARLTVALQFSDYNSLPQLKILIRQRKNNMGRQLVRRRGSLSLPLRPSPGAQAGKGSKELRSPQRRS